MNTVHRSRCRTPADRVGTGSGTRMMNVKVMTVMMARRIIACHVVHPASHTMPMVRQMARAILR